MLSKHKKLKEWVAAGLMTEVQSDAIHDYESARKRRNFGRNLVGLSLFAILIGVLSVIASNWNVIPPAIKIGVHGLLNIGVGFAAYASCRKNNIPWSEGLTFAFFGLTLTLIILIGQVFQLDGSHAGALLFWMLATLPFMVLFSQTRFTAVPWMIAFLGTFYVNLFHYLDVLPDAGQAVFYHAVAIFLPLAMMAAGHIGLFRKHKFVWADMFLRFGMILMVITTSLALLLWGENLIKQSVMNKGWGFFGHISIYMSAYIGVIVFALAQNFLKDEGRLVLGIKFALTSITFCMIVYLLLPYSNEALRATAFITYWIFLGWAAQSAGFMRVVTLAIIIIAIRIFAFYIELFGSLMDTGIGLIVGGLVMLGFMALARRINRHVVTRKSGDGHAV